MSNLSPYPAYPAYKDSCFNWLGHIPDHWEISAIGRSMSLGRGRVISHEDIGANPGDYPVYSSQTSENGVMGYLGTYDFEGEYVTWTTDGAKAGTVFYREGKFNCTNVCGTMQAKPHAIEKVSLAYIPFVLNLGTGFYVRYDINPKLMNNIMARIPLLLPPIEEQRAIVRFLDRKTADIDRCLANKRRLIALLNEQKSALIYRAVTRGLNPEIPLKPSGVEWLGMVPKHWDILPLKRKWTVTDCKHLTVPFVDEGIPVASISEVKSLCINLSKAKRTTYEDYLHLIEGDRQPHKGDIIYSRNATVGEAAYVDTDEVFCMGQDVTLIRSEAQNQQFLVYQLRSPFVLYQVDQLVIGSTFKRINVGDIKTFLICCPPTLEEQVAIVAYIQEETGKVDQVIRRTEREIELMQEYRAALVAEAVTGKIDVRTQTEAE